MPCSIKWSCLSRPISLCMQTVRNAVQIIRRKWLTRCAVCSALRPCLYVWRSWPQWTRAPICFPFFQNGTLKSINSATGRLEPPHPTHKLSTCANVDYVPWDELTAEERHKVESYVGTLWPDARQRVEVLAILGDAMPSLATA